MADTVLELQSVSSGYGRTAVLHEVDLCVERGEFLAVLGPNGAGKSSLLRTISGLLRPSHGRIRLCGDDITSRKAHKITRAGIAHVPEGRQVFPDLTVAVNLELSGAMSGRRAAPESGDVLSEVYTLFPRLADRRLQQAGTLSGGEAQMLAIGRALMSRPILLLLDEPSLGLAPRAVVETFQHLRDLHRDRGLSILLVEQLVTTALAVAQRGVLLHRGAVQRVGTPAELLADPQVQSIGIGDVGPQHARPGVEPATEHPTGDGSR